MKTDDTRQIEIVLPRARLIVWLVLKVYLITIVGAGLLMMTAMLLGVVLIAAHHFPCLFRTRYCRTRSPFKTAVESL